jgi:hypothetical protein
MQAQKNQSGCGIMSNKKAEKVLKKISSLTDDIMNIKKSDFLHFERFEMISELNILIAFASGLSCGLIDSINNDVEAQAKS